MLVTMRVSYAEHQGVGWLNLAASSIVDGHYATRAAARVRADCDEAPQDPEELLSLMIQALAGLVHS